MSEQLSAILDGHSRPFFIRGIEGLTPDVRGIYRPMRMQERGNMYSACDKPGMTAGDRFANQAKWIVKHGHVNEWDVKDRHGNELKVTAENYLALHPLTFQRLTDIVLGDAAPDVDDQAPHLVDHEDEEAAEKNCA